MERLVSLSREATLILDYKNKDVNFRFIQTKDLTPLLSKYDAFSQIEDYCSHISSKSLNLTFELRSTKPSLGIFVLEFSGVLRVSDSKFGTFITDSKLLLAPKLMLFDRQLRAIEILIQKKCPDFFCPSTV